LCIRLKKCYLIEKRWVIELLNCQNATVSHHSFDSIALDREMRGSGSSVGAISCLSVEKSKVSANLCKKSILNTISPFFSQRHLWLRDARDWRQRKGDIQSVGGDMMALVAGSHLLFVACLLRKFLGTMFLCNDIWLLTPGPVIKLPFIVEQKANLQNKN
jgi:hypothetical protein